MKKEIFNLLSVLLNPLMAALFHHKHQIISQNYHNIVDPSVKKIIVTTRMYAARYEKSHFS